ncbi:MAG: MFS transporter [Rhodocyclaceae bacterium]|nr:MFS transporter [Rhodocyclaceae bacterium]MBX3668051.1 MFS transporter [Rhodocyclaceae bacterium]
MAIQRVDAAICTAGFVAFLNLYPPQALLPELEAAFGTASGGTTITVSAGTLAVALVAPFAGILADTFGRRRVIVASMCGLAIATLLCGSATTLTQMLVWRFVCGLFVPGISTGALGVLAEDQDRTRALRVAGLYIAGTVLGGFMGRFLTGLVAHWFGWRHSFHALGLVSLCLVPLVMAGVPKPAAATRSGTLATLRAAATHLDHAELRTTFAMGFLLLFTQVATFTYVSLLLARPPYNFNSATIGFVFASYLAGVVVTPHTGRLVARHGRRRVATLAALLGVAGACCTLWPTVTAIALGLSIGCASIFMLQSLATGYVAEAARHTKSAASGLYTTAYYLGGSAGALFPKVLWNSGGWPACVALIASMYLLLAWLARRLWPAPTQAPD